VQYVFYDDFKPGVLRDGKVYDLAAFLGPAGERGGRAIVEAIIARNGEIASSGKAFAGGGKDVGSVRLREPVPDPRHIVCAARNYKDEREAPAANFFLKGTATLVGNGDTCVMPPVDVRTFHAEPELAVVIGKEAYNVSAADAMAHVFGYTCFLDVSARGVASGYYMHKSYATFGPLGPAIVTADEVPDPHELRVQLWVNDIKRQDFSTSQMANDIPRLIEAASSVHPLMPGDVLATGTHHTDLYPVADGDTVTVEIEKVGRLSVKIRDDRKRRWPEDAKKD
jgi:2-keto-4-pentenoate hydratase/2-oxohepta-3-ene-1,7-dioic acid hydratase in catechol pathway